MVKHTQTNHWLLPTNCLSEFDHFVGLALKELIYLRVEGGAPQNLTGGARGGSLSQNMRRIWGELKMLSKNTCEGLHLIKKLPAISLQASKFTARMPPAHYGKPCTYSDFSETSVSGEHIGILMQSNSKAILNHYFPSLNLFCK